MLDLAIADRNTGQIRILLANGIGGLYVAYTTSVATPYASHVLADINSDGHLDLILESAQPLQSTAILLGDGTGRFGPPEYTAFYLVTGVDTVADINGDGIPDIVTCDPSANAVSIEINDGKGHLLPPISFAAGSKPSAVFAADLNGDHLNDLVINNAGVVSVLQNRSY
jgi:hypothetical protein